MEIVRIGMVGARHGATLHLENLGSMRGQRVEIVGICSQSRESAEDCGRRFNIPFVTTDFAALLAHKDVDAVDCASRRPSIIVSLPRPRLPESTLSWKNR